MLFQNKKFEYIFVTFWMNMKNNLDKIKKKYNNFFLILQNKEILNICLKSSLACLLQCIIYSSLYSTFMYLQDIFVCLLILLTVIFFALFIDSNDNFSCRKKHFYLFPEIINCVNFVSVTKTNCKLWFSSCTGPTFKQCTVRTPCAHKHFTYRADI